VDHFAVHMQDEVAVVTLQRGKVNAINTDVVRELRGCLDELVVDQDARALVLTGAGKFFSFGLDVPELYPLSEEAFTRFLTDFTGLYTRLYNYPKPVIAALNGHAIAGGCMLALACDARWMAAGEGKLGLNEITFGAAVFAGSVEMLEACIGPRRAGELLLTGALYSPEQALALGLADRVVPSGELLPACVEEARLRASRPPETYASLKRLLRGPATERMRRREPDSIREFVKIWYSTATREQLQGIVIRG
jgi:Delta3-Delta2-enoyl-CoA isomerase